MSQTQEKKTSQSATTRAEELLNRVGKGLGVFAASTSQRVQDAATTVRERVDQRNQPTATHGEKPSQAKPASPSTHEAKEETMERADELVSRVEVRMSYITSLVSLNIQRTTARLREEAEDMWAEAQHIRHQNRRKPQ
ncbi:MAG: hypothetical protein ABI234_16155 [Ktedonobacteraceae bacterium]